jgi:hypothetical protein
MQLFSLASKNVSHMAFSKQACQSHGIQQASMAGNKQSCQSGNISASTSATTDISQQSSKNSARAISPDLQALAGRTMTAKGQDACMKSTGDAVEAVELCNVDRCA